MIVTHLAHTGNKHGILLEAFMSDDYMDPPKTDELIHRHQFYAAIAVVTLNSKIAITVIGKKLDTLVTKYDIVHDTVKAIETRNKTLIKTAIVIWTVIGGGVGWYLERTVNHFDLFVDRVNAIEKKNANMEPDVAKIKELQDKVEAIKRIAVETQRQVDEIEARKK